MLTKYERGKNSTICKNEWMILVVFQKHIGFDWVFAAKIKNFEEKWMNKPTPHNKNFKYSFPESKKNNENKTKKRQKEWKNERNNKKERQTKCKKFGKWI